MALFDASFGEVAAALMRPMQEIERFVQKTCVSNVVVALWSLEQHLPSQIDESSRLKCEYLKWSIRSELENVMGCKDRSKRIISDFFKEQRQKNIVQNKVTRRIVYYLRLFLDDVSLKLIRGRYRTKLKASRLLRRSRSKVRMTRRERFRKIIHGLEKCFIIYRQRYLMESGGVTIPNGCPDEDQEVE